MLRSPSCFSLLVLGLMLSAAPIEQAKAQSNDVSTASAASLDASMEVPVAVYDALKAGTHFTVIGVEASARGTVLTLSIAPAFGSILLAGLVEPDYNLLSGSPNTRVGTALVVSGGLLLMVGSLAIAFLPEPSARAHIHSRRLGP